MKKWLDVYKSKNNHVLMLLFIIWMIITNNNKYATIIDPRNLSNNTNTNHLYYFEGKLIVLYLNKFFCQFIMMFHHKLNFFYLFSENF